MQGRSVSILRTQERGQRPTLPHSPGTLHCISREIFARAESRARAGDISQHKVFVSEFLVRSISILFRNGLLKKMGAFKKYFANVLPIYFAT